MRVTDINMARINLAALDVIEACTASYHASGPFAESSSNRHRFRAEQAMKKIADELGFDLVKRNVVPLKAAE
jgi:hypothetical protein